MIVKFGLAFSPSEPFADLRRKWRIYERVGINSLWLFDHQVSPFKPESPYLDAWTLLSALATFTIKARIGVLVTCNSFRHPSVLVRQIQTVDEISNGRLIVGLGAGWYKPEHDILGIPIPSHPVRQFRSTVELVHRALREEVIASHDYPPIQDWIVRPRPVRGPNPILIGGHGPRILGIAADYAQIWNSFGTPEEMSQRNFQLSEMLIRRGKSLQVVERTIHIWRGLTPQDPWESTQAFADVMGAYAECGLTGFIIDAPKDSQFETFIQCMEGLPK